jgi:predicted RNase H-like HicB family nuclease
MKSFTAIIKKGEKQFVALCPELDVVSQGHSIEEALINLKEATELYIEEMGFTEEPKDTFIVNFEVNTNDKATQIVG